MKNPVVENKNSRLKKIKGALAPFSLLLLSKFNPFY